MLRCRPDEERRHPYLEGVQVRFGDRARFWKCIPAVLLSGTQRIQHRTRALRMSESVGETE